MNLHDEYKFKVQWNTQISENLQHKTHSHLDNGTLIMP